MGLRSPAKGHDQPQVLRLRDVMESTEFPRAQGLKSLLETLSDP